jgi:hypothetical protein
MLGYVEASPSDFKIQLLLAGRFRFPDAAVTHSSWLRRMTCQPVQEPLSFAAKV